MRYGTSIGEAVGDVLGGELDAHEVVFLDLDARGCERELIADDGDFPDLALRPGGAGGPVGGDNADSDEASDQANNDLPRLSMHGHPPHQRLTGSFIWTFLRGV